MINENTNKDVKRETWNLLGEMILAILLYLPWFIAAIALIAFGAHLTIKGVVNVFSNPNFAVLIGLLLLLLLGWFLIIQFCSFALGPFAVLMKKDKPEGVEITAEQMPELFKLIGEVATATGNPMPKHVYLTEESNAAVFYDKPWRSAFMRGRKNLIIGKRLFYGFNVNELKSILAHEFGHFSQETMRLGQPVYVMNTFLSAIAASNTKWDLWISKLMYFPWILGYGIVWSLAVRMLGWTLYAITHALTWMMRKLYDRIQLDHNRLRRKQEYAADAVAVEIAGREAFISGHCKLQLVDERYNLYLNFLARLGEDRLRVDDFWESFTALNDVIDKKTGIVFNHKTFLDKTHDIYHLTKIDVEYINVSHPSTKQRINHIEQLNSVSVDSHREMNDAMSLLPHDFAQDYGAQLYNIVLKELQTNPPTIIAGEQLSQRMEESMEWLKIYYAFKENIIPFNLEEIEDDEQLTLDAINHEAGRLAVSEYEAAKYDLSIANAFVNGETKDQQATYDGEVYLAHNMPTDLIKQRVEETTNAVTRLQQDFYRLVCRNAGSLKDNVKQAYTDIFTFQEFLTFFSETLDPLRDKVFKAMSNYHHTNSQFEDVSSALGDLQYDIKTNLKLLIDNNSLSLSKEETMAFNDFLGMPYLSYADKITGEQINFLLYIYDLFRNALKRNAWELKFEIMTIIVNPSILSESQLPATSNTNDELPQDHEPANADNDQRFEYISNLSIPDDESSQDHEPANADNDQKFKYIIPDDESPQDHEPANAGNAHIFKDITNLSIPDEEFTAREEYNGNEGYPTDESETKKPKDSRHGMILFIFALIILFLFLQIVL